MSEDFKPDGYIDGLPFKAADLPAKAFPFLVRYLEEGEGYGLGQGPMVGWTLVDGPGVMKVPGFGADHKVSVQVMHNDGTAVLTTSDGQNYYAEMEPGQAEAVRQIASAIAEGVVENGHMPPTEEKT